MAYNSVMRFARLPLSAQTAYARLLDTLLSAEAGGAFDEGVTLTSKRIKGHTYWYAQRYVDGKKVQKYLGRESPELLQTLERWRRGRETAANRAELVAVARAAGAYTVSAAEGRVLAMLAPAFQRGAVLVGSHAFAVLGSSLGVRWQDASVRTQDVDLVHDPSIAVVVEPDLEPIQLDKALDGAIPLFDVLNPSSPATTFRVRGEDIEVDLLTPLIGRARNEPVAVPLLRAAATPLRFLDYLIEENQPGAVLGAQGALVRVPRPGRFALHKLLVASRRTPQTGGAAKATKDREQASALVELLDADLPGEIELAWKALEEHGKAWVTAVRESVGRLGEDTVEVLAKYKVRPAARRR
jgi:hypothetical protein